MEHVFTESMFLVGFVIFIAAILVLDMLVIDRKAHVVSIKEAGSWTAVWIILALAFAVFIYFHGDMVHGIENFDDLKLIASRYASHLKLDPNDYEGSLQQYRHYMTISYISGYLIEKTLSVDNLFVMMMIFTSFGVDKKDYQHVSAAFQFDEHHVLQFRTHVLGGIEANAAHDGIIYEINLLGVQHLHLYRWRILHQLKYHIGLFDVFQIVLDRFGMTDSYYLSKRRICDALRGITGEIEDEFLHLLLVSQSIASHHVTENDAVVE